MQKDSKLIAKAYFKQVLENETTNLEYPNYTDHQALQLADNWVKSYENGKEQGSLSDYFMPLLGKVPEQNRANLLERVWRASLNRGSYGDDAKKYDLKDWIDWGLKTASSFDDRKPYNFHSQDDESADRTDQDPNDKSAIDYAREDKAAAERDKWTQGQGVGGKFHF
jgi:hypothetical protein